MFETLIFLKKNSIFWDQSMVPNAMKMKPAEATERMKQGTTFHRTGGRALAGRRGSALSTLRNKSKSTL